MNELLLLVVYSVGSLVSLISVLAVCVCGCRKGAPKNDLLGLDGMVKITNPDENVNHLPAVGNYVPDAENCNTENDEHKRPSAGSNPHRSLPDIPVIASDVNGDTSSELYATVDDKTVSLVYNKRHTLPNGVDAGPSLSHQSSISQSDSNYARLKENPYDKVKKSENPYANVKSSNNKENDESSREPSPQTSWNNIARTTTDSVENISVDQTILERRRASAQSSQNLGNTSPILDIPAATAVAGRVAASQDLPYMTPPITQPQHFSGDSQDSSRGYTSISVREPLANILSQTPAIRNRRTDLDPHYSTVSDDSDEMYAAIVEPNSNIYNGSETYAQIQPITVAVDIHGQSGINNDQQEEEEDDQYEPAPQPPSVDSLKHVAHVHSRQASSSSCTSSVANLGSPKPEKRQANSPLPPPPAISPDLYSRIDKANEDNSPHNLTVVRNLEDMYAKVHKNKKKSDETDANANVNANANANANASSSTTKSELIPFQKPAENKRNSIDGIDAVSIHSIDDTEKSQKIHVTHKQQHKADEEEHCYETLNKDKKCTKANWEIAVSGPESLLSNDPGYEQLNPQNRPPSESDPNYEVLRPQRTSSVTSDNSLGYSTIGKCNKSTLTVNPNYTPVPQTKASCSDDGYSVVNKNKHKIIDEPNYESMPDYATIHKSTGSESDPNYESVKYLCEPPYEQLEDDENAAKYEQINDRSKSSDNSEKTSSSATPDYERIKDSSKSSDNSLDHSDKSGTPDYQRIKSSETSETESNNNEDQASIILTVTSDITEVKINIPNSVVVVKEIHENTDIFHV